MAGPITDQWTGNGLAEETPVSSNAVAQTAGNFTGSGVVWTRAGAAPTFRTRNNGFEVLGADGDAGRIDGTVNTPQTGLLAQVRVTRGPIGTAKTRFLEFRTLAGAVLGFFEINIDTASIEGYVQAPQGTFHVSAQFPNGIEVGDVLLLDACYARHSTPATNNNRLFFRLKNKTRPTWNTNGEFFWDSGYSIASADTASPAVCRFGKLAGGLMSGTPTIFEFLGLQPVTVNPSHTSEAQAKAYFADEPAVSTPLAAATVTLQSVSHPTSNGASDGTATVSWPAVPNAVRYRAGFTMGDADAPPTTIVSSDAVSPFTFTGLPAGVRSLFIQPMAS